MSFFSSITPDQLGQLLGTRYQRFNHWLGITGLVQIRDSRLDLLAIISTDPGRGNLRSFIRMAQEEFETICVWVVENEALAAALERYGFTPETEIAFDGVPVHGYRWDNTK